MVFQKRLTHLLVWVTCDSLLRKRMLLHSHTHQPIKCKHAFFKYPWVKLWNDTCLQKFPRGGEGFTFWPMDYYEDYLPMSRTKTNRKTDREKYTRSNNATTTLPTLVKLAETLARDWPNTTTRNGDVNNHIVEHHLQMKHQIDWDSATCITYSTDTINDSL